jgi:hypothetical protein
MQEYYLAQGQLPDSCGADLAPGNSMLFTLPEHADLNVRFNGSFTLSRCFCFDRIEHTVYNCAGFPLVAMVATVT